MKFSIFDTLEKLNLTSFETRKLFNERTRDVDNLKVWKDDVSGVIYIDGFYAGDDVYIDGSFRNEAKATGKIDFERSSNTARRVDANLKYIAGKDVVDFGCGRGEFLRHIEPYCKSVMGVELQQNYVDSLNADSIDCVNDLKKINDCSVDVFVSFHVIEHLPEPLETLLEIKNKIKSGGTLIVEVPHANDFLLSFAPSEQFKQFTLWSQHLVLHTRESLRRMLEFVGFIDVRIEGVQRYPLSNHINWLVNGKPGGHKSELSIIDSPALNIAYESSLSRIDATDTLVAIMKVP